MSTGFTLKGFGNQSFTLHLTPREGCRLFASHYFFYPSTLFCLHHTRQTAQVHSDASTHRLSKRMRQATSLLSVTAECCTGSCPATEGCLVAVMTWHRVEDDADLNPNTTRAPAGFKHVTTDSFGTLGMDEFSDRR